MAPSSTVSGLRLLLLLLGLLATGRGAIAQIDTSERTFPAAEVDTIGVDSLEFSQPTTGGPSGIDTLVDYSARDSIIVDVKRKRVKLYGDAILVRGSTRLTAAYIEVDFTGSELRARAAYDSATKKYYGIPVFREGSNEVSATELSYNFRTRRATLSAAETRFEDGFYYAERTKKVNDNTFFVENGAYTTCDAPHPHYYFASPRMKAVAGDRIFADQVALNIADVPVFFIPFGVYFAAQGGKESGLIIPSPSQSSTFGFSLLGLGYFWAGNEYVDSKFTADLHSKGGYTLRNDTRFVVNDWKLSATPSLKFTRGRDDVDDELGTDYTIAYYHNQQISRKTSISGNLNFSSQNAIRKSTTRRDVQDRLNDITTQEVSSNLTLSTSFDLFGANVGVFTGYNRTQNIITDVLRASVPLRVSLPNWTPFATGSSGEPGLLDRLTLGYSGSGNVLFLREVPDTLVPGGFRVRDTKMAFTHQPSISYSLSIADYFTLTPQVSTTWSWFPRRTSKQLVGNTIITSTTNQFGTAFFWDAGALLSTKFYGIVQPRILGLNAIRHTIIPRVRFTYTPEYTKYYETVFDTAGRAIPYSIFEADQGAGGIVPQQGKSQRFDFGISNIFEAKIAQGDTLEDRKVTLLNLELNTSYNPVAFDNLRWSLISASANTNLGSIGNLSGNASFDLYDDSLGVRIPEFLFENGKGWLRVISAGFSIHTSFSDQGFTTGNSLTTLADSAEARRGRFSFEPIPFNEEEFFGERVRGQSEFRLPWELDFTVSYSLNRVQNGDISEFKPTLGVQSGFSFSLTPTTRISSRAYFDLDQGKIRIPSISLTKDLHCWEMVFDWQPAGATGGSFYFRLGLKAPHLQDIQIEQRGY